MKATFLSIAIVAFGAGCYIGWKTTLKVIDSVNKRFARD